MGWKIKIDLGAAWEATKNSVKKVKDSVVGVGKSIINADEEKIELIMRTKNVDRATAKKMLKEFRETKDKESVKSITLDNLKR